MILPDLERHEAQTGYGGLALQFTRSGEAASIRDSIKRNDGFSFTFSTRDTKPIDSELCIVLFKPNVLHSVWLGRFSAETPTGRRRLRFDNHVFLGNLDISELGAPRNVEDPLNYAFLYGDEYKLSPRDWRQVINWIKTKKPELELHLDELEALREEASRPIQESGQQIIAEQWDATGAAMDFSGFERTKYLLPSTKAFLVGATHLCLILTVQERLKKTFFLTRCETLAGGNCSKNAKAE